MASYSRFASGIAAGTVSRYIASNPALSAHAIASTTSRRPSLNPRNAPSTQRRFISHPPFSSPRKARKATQPAAIPSTSASNRTTYPPGSPSSSSRYPSRQIFAAPAGFAARCSPYACIRHRTAAISSTSTASRTTISAIIRVAYHQEICSTVHLKAGNRTRKNSRRRFFQDQSARPVTSFQP
jgi:hypothetical protein